MIAKLINSRFWLLTIVVIAIAALFLEYGTSLSIPVFWTIQILDFTVLFLLFAEFFYYLASSTDKISFIRKNKLEIAFIIAFTSLFLYSKVYSFAGIIRSGIAADSLTLVIMRNIFIAMKIFSRFRKLNILLKSFISKPAQTIVLSFALLILTGTLLLMLPYSSQADIHTPFADALFTSTSAVCVTGLIVVDTGSHFSMFGKAVIMLLIQFGGLGIMMFGFFTAFIIGKRISIEDRIALSYMLGEDDQLNIQKSVFKIISTTFVIEGIGAIFMFTVFDRFNMSLPMKIFYSLFHSVSAFCNAGFALFSDSLESMSSSMTMVLTVAFLIILGGLGFSVYNNLYSRFKGLFIKNILHKRVIVTKLSLNSRIVLLISAGLIVSGMLLIYTFEHRTIFTGLPLKEQYLNAFFQSVTLRTAGFNSIDFTSLRPPTYILMMLFMFIGGAAGSTAGGVKVNTLAVLYAHLVSVMRDKDRTILFNHFISRETILKAFLSVIIGLLIVFTGILALSITENADPINTAFEVVSAFGTVGLSAGLTPHLTFSGKIIIILIMFTGRLGILTVISALAKTQRDNVRYPEGSINIG